MTRFQDGPAQGQRLYLQRAPALLRVTEAAGKFDALDQQGDRPKPNETLYAYTIVALDGYAFVDGSRVCGRFAMATYRLAETQPTDAEMRDETRWHNWCMENDPRAEKF